MKIETEKPTAWKMLCGSPSWHQRRAGHTCASTIVLMGTRSFADQWAADYTARNGQSCTVVRASVADIPPPPAVPDSWIL